MRYSIEQYDKNGFLKAPLTLWLGWLFLAKAWVVFIVAGASRDSGAKILEIVYPDHSMLYLGIAMGLPSILLMWLIGLRNADRKWINMAAAYGREVSLLVTTLQIAQTVYHVYLDHGLFRWSNAVTLVILLWLAIYLYKSRTVKACFAIPEFNNEESKSG
ncbi:DUF2919 domain-containing protein [Vibrio sp. T187]|uniref:DUF2919 domain-containing protein n=1 Tax=Vibrio TaxID=662 RepID=UPI0010C93CF7|nr:MULTISPECIES: DUF2919 domain-containing protein [Vibrio]MBW3694404.1 DUF2919 domain-containing protein [Vibrio sp. T187]